MSVALGRGGQRALTALDAWDALPLIEAEIFADFAFRETRRGGVPIAAFTSTMIEARLWAAHAHAAEVEAYALACFEAMTGERQGAFLSYVQGRAAA